MSPRLALCLGGVPSPRAMLQSASRILYLEKYDDNKVYCEDRSSSVVVSLLRITSVRQACIS